MSFAATLPRLTLEAGGRLLSAGELQALGEVRVQQRLSLPTLCELAFFDPPGSLEVAATLVPGTALRVAVEGHAVPLFVGEVTVVEYRYGATREQELRVRGYDSLHRLRKRQPVRAHVEVTPRTLVEELIADLGVRLEGDLDGSPWQHLIQHYQSDFELLAEVVEQAGLCFTLRDNILHVVTLAGVGEALPLRVGETLLEARVEVTGETPCRTVAVAGWNPLRVESHEASAERARSGRAVSATTEPDAVGGSGERGMVGGAVQDERHAQALAQAELDRRVAREVTLWGIAEGNPALRPATSVEVSGLAPPIAGRYVLTAVTHTIDSRQGFVSELSSSPPPPRERPQGGLVAFGTVTRVDDPESVGRVRVLLPTYGGLETEWLHVLSLGAGAQKGLMLLPNAGDRVLLLFSHQEPGQGVVLGGLYGMDGPPDSGVEGNAVQRYTLLTAGGQRLTLDDSTGTFRLETQEGSHLELSPTGVRLHAATDLTIEAPGQAVIIRGKTVDFERV